MFEKVRTIIIAIYRVVVFCLNFIIKKILFPLLRPVVRLLSKIVEEKKEEEEKTMVQWKEEALKDFSEWIEDLPDNLPATKGASMDSCDLYTLLCEFVALRHEIKLQNKEQGDALKAFSSTIDLFRKTADNFMDRSRNLSELEDKIRNTSEKKIVVPFLDIRDALLEERKIAQKIAGEKGFFTRPPKGMERILEGYEAIVKHFNSALEAAGFSRIDAVGQPFDSSTMNAVEKCSVPDTDKGVVVEERRSGYMHDDELIRKADVVVSK